jgi:hypothetical protein
LLPQARRGVFHSGGTRISPAFRFGFIRLYRPALSAVAPPFQRTEIPENRSKKPDD